MARVTTFSGVVPLTLFLAACNAHVTGELDLSSLSDFVDGSVDQTAPATLAIQVVDEEDCAKHALKIAETLAGILKDFTPLGCENMQGDSYLMADINIPIIDSFNNWLATDSLLGFWVRSTGSDKLYVEILLDTGKFQAANALSADSHYTLTNSRITTILNNDGLTSLSFSVSDVFVNSSPVQDEQTFNLERRHKAHIQLSDVAVAKLERSGRAKVLALNIPRETTNPTDDN